MTALACLIKVSCLFLLTLSSIYIIVIACLLLELIDTLFNGIILILLIYISHDRVETVEDNGVY